MIDGCLTAQGRRFVQSITAIHGSPDAGLTTLGDLQGSRRRLLDELPAWETVLSHHVEQFGPARIVLGVISESVSSGCTLPELVTRLARIDPVFATEAFLIDEALPAPETLPKSDQLATSTPYTGTATNHLKGLLYHTGYLTERGSDTSRLDPEEDTWELGTGVVIDWEPTPVAGGDRDDA